MCKWLKDARAVAFSALSGRLQWKRIHHAPLPVIPLVYSAGGGLLDEDDKGALPAPPDHNGRHWVRVALSSVLLKNANNITSQCLSRRALSVLKYAYNITSQCLSRRALSVIP